MRSAILALVAAFPISATSAEVSLDGTWHSCFQSTDALPGASVDWKPIEVPSLVGRVEGKPFLWYRRTLSSPAKFDGERLFLRIGASRYVTTVFSNGSASSTSSSIVCGVAARHRLTSAGTGERSRP